VFASIYSHYIRNVKLDWIGFIMPVISKRTKELRWDEVKSV